MFDGGPPVEAAGRVRRYWLLTNEAPGSGGGVGVYTDQTARMLAARGVVITVLHHDPHALDPQSGFKDGYRLLRFGTRGLDGRPIPHANLQGPLRAAREVAHVVAELIAGEGAPDMLEAPDYAALAHGVLKDRLMHPDRDWPPVVVTAHRPHLHCVLVDDEGASEHSTAFLGDLERWCYAAADRVLSPCRFILEPLAALGFQVTDAAVVFNPYAPPAAAAPCALGPERLELQRRLHTAEEPVLLFGKLQAQKGAPDLLASLDALQTQGEAPPLWLFGRDAFLSGTPTTAYDALERRHRRLFASGRVRYLGGYGAPDMAALCAGHPVVALPYREDCLPYAFIEAVMAGALPLTSARGGQLELAPAELRDALSADATRPDAWAAKAAALLALDPAARAALSARLRASVGAAIAPDAVFEAKMAALAGVRPTHRSGRYPFGQAGAITHGRPDPARRAALAERIELRGAVREVRCAGPDAQLHPDLVSPNLVSVVIPFFEMQAYLDETLASVEAQDHPAIEVVIVDDGSPSPAARSALQAVLDGPRRFTTRVVRKTNGGLADARNAGAKLAQGAFLYFLDADDLIHPGLIARSLALLSRYGNVGYVGAGLKEFGESEAEWAVHDIDGAYIGFHNLQICAFLARAEAWLEHGANDPRMSLGMEDYESHLRLFAAGVRGIAIPEPLFRYRKRPGSMSKAFEPHGTAFLYRRILQASPELFRRFGPELVGLHAENGHGATAPSIGVETPGHRALFARDIPGRAELADGLERRASRADLGRALRGRCQEPGAEWDYTTARLLLALDHQPAFARQLLRSAVAAEPANGWFRLYAMVAALRDGRLGEADGLWTTSFEAFCRQEGAAIGWVSALEAGRGFPQVERALGCWMARRAQVALPCTLPRLDGEGAGGPFAALHAALDLLRRALAKGREAVEEAEADVRERAAADLSPEAVEALLVRWRGTWAEAGLQPGRRPMASAPTFWGRAAGAYLQPDPTPALAPEEAAERARWLALQPQADPSRAAAARLKARLLRLAGAEAQRVSATASPTAAMM